jgi:hypothetical protein
VNMLKCDRCGKSVSTDYATGWKILQLTTAGYHPEKIADLCRECAKFITQAANPETRDERREQ